MWGDIESRIVPLERARIDLDTLEARAAAVGQFVVEAWALVPATSSQIIKTGSDTFTLADTGFVIAEPLMICLTLTGCCSTSRVGEEIIVLGFAEEEIGRCTTDDDGKCCVEIPNIGTGFDYTIRVESDQYTVIDLFEHPTVSPFNLTITASPNSGHVCFGPCILDSTVTLTLDGSGCDSTIGLLTPFFSGTFNWVEPDAAYSALGLGTKAWISNEFFTFPFAPPRQQTCQMHLTLTSPCNFIGIELIFKHTNGTDGNETRLDTGLTAQWSDPGNTCNPVVLSNWIDTLTGNPCDMVLGE